MYSNFRILFALFKIFTDLKFPIPLKSCPETESGLFTNFHSKEVDAKSTFVVQLMFLLNIPEQIVSTLSRFVTLAVGLTMYSTSLFTPLHAIELLV